MLTTPTRTFLYDNLNLEDPNPDLSPEDVKEIYAAIYTELTQATVEGPEPSDKGLVYTFKRTYGIKGQTITVEDVAQGRHLDVHQIHVPEASGKLMAGIAAALSHPGNDPLLPYSDAQGML